MAENKNIELDLEVDQPVVVRPQDSLPSARMTVAVTVRNRDGGLINVGASNFEFRLDSVDSGTIEYLHIPLGDEFHLTQDGETQTFRCLLRARNKSIDPNEPYRLKVEAFGETAEQEFEFTELADMPT